MQQTVPTFRLSPQQDALWRSGTAPAFVQLDLTLAGELDHDDVLRAFNLLAQRHEILRTRVAVAPGHSAASQSVAPHDPAASLPGHLRDSDAPWQAALRRDGDHTLLSVRASAFCADVWTLPALLRGLSDICAPDPAGSEASEILQYPDVAQALIEMLDDPQGRRYWEVRQAGAPASPALRGALDGSRLGGHGAAIDLAGDLQPAHDDALVFSHWVLFLTRLTGAAGIAVDYRDPGQSGRFGDIELFGPTARLLPLSFAVDGGRPVSWLLRSVAETTRSDLDRATHCPGPSATRDPAQPRFQFDPGWDEPQSFAGRPVVRFEVSEPRCDATFRLSISCSPGQRRMRVSTSNADASLLAETASNFMRFLDFCARWPDRPLNAFEWQALEADAPTPVRDPVPDLRTFDGPPRAVERWAQRTPGRTALSDSTGTLDYAQLLARTRSCAGALAGLGVQAGDVVALQLDRGIEWVLLWLACWELGAVPMPASVNEPAVRLARMCRRAGARFLVRGSEGAATADLPAVLSLAQLVAAEQSGRLPPPRRTPAPQAAAYILFTSGSTGEPKATAVSHGALAAYLDWACVAYASNRAGGTLVHSELTFDFTQTCLWVPLMNGETVQFAPPGLGVEGLAGMLAEGHRLSFVKLTPGHLQAFTTIESAGAVELRWPQHVVVGGAALTGAMLPASMRRSAAIVHNEYGPTEATVGCSLYSAPAAALPDGPVSIGEPTPGSRFQVLDEYGNRVRPGDSGELYIGGEQLALGYLQGPKETALRFVPDPFSGEAGARMYRSGDRVSRTTAHGYVFMGRMDDMVKRNGFRIEPGEITACLLRHGSVSGCHTFAVPGSDGAEPDIVAATVGSADAGELQRWLAGELPAYLLPNRVEVVAELPLTRQGKVDEPRLKQSLALARPDPEPPMEGTEAALAALWRTVLGGRAIGRASNFFAEGGDSIRAITAAVHGRRAGLALSVEDLFAHPVLRDLARHIDAGRTQAAIAPLAQEPEIDLPPGAVDAFPLSSMQLGMIFQNQAHEGASRYHDIFSYRLRLDLDEACLRAAVHRLIERHGALRTSFDLTRPGDPLQIVWASAGDPLTVADISQLTAVQQARAIEGWIEDERRRGFDVARPPLVRFMVHRLAPGEIQFTTSFHHAVMDGWSDQQIHTELFEDYRALRRGEAAVLVAPGRYRDFVAAERAALNSDASRRFWADAVGGRRPNALAPGPAGDERPAPGQDQYRSAAIALPPDTQRSLRQLAQQAGLPLATLLLAAHVAALRLIAGQNDILTTTVANCRLDEDGAERAVGLYINTLPVAVRIHEGSWLQLARQTEDWLRQALPHRRFPFAEIQRSHGGPLSESLFYFTSFHNGIAPNRELVQLGKTSHEITSFPLAASFNLDPAGGALSGVVCLEARRFTPARSVQVAELYALVLDSLAAGLDGRIPTGSCLPPPAQSLLHGRRPAGGEGLSVPALLAEHAALHADRLAIDAPDARVSHAELDSWSDAVALSLARSGVRGAAVVGIRLARSAKLVATVLGVLKSGASFALLDPADSPARQRHVLSGLDALVSEQAAEAGSGFPATGIWLVPVASAPAPAPATWAWPVDLPQRPAYRMHTSGSTGVPKCVVIGHASLATVLRHFRAEMRVQAADRMLLASALSFDISLLEMLLPLVSGAALVIPARDDLMDPLALVRAIDDSGATLVQATPSLWSLIRAAGWTGSRHVRAIAGGEPLPPHLAQWLTQACGEAWNVYGPTESTIWATSKRLGAGALTLGTPIAGTDCYVLDDLLEPCPRGTAGELYLSGAGLAQAYAQAPAETASAFLPDPHAALPGARMYRTGDHALVDEHGDIVFLGRRDRQIKLAGHRLELGEVEAHLLDHPAVGTAIVTVRGEPATALVAYLVAGAAITQLPAAGELRSWLAQRLPVHALPLRFVWITDVPRTPNGKLDLAALPQPDRASHANAPARPLTPLERVLQQLWSRVLRQPEVGLHDTFTELGGYSLTAIQIVMQVRSLLAVDVSAAVIFATPTVASFAEHLLRRFPQARLDEKAELMLSVL